MAIMFYLQGCLLDLADGCVPPPDFKSTDLGGAWSGMIRDAIPVQYELVQRHPTVSLGQPSQLAGTVSITIAGPVEASGAVTGRTAALGGCELDRIYGQSVRLQAVLSVTPGDNIDLALTMVFVGRPMGTDVLDGLVQYAGPTSVTFGPGGEVVNVELDAFTDGFFTLTREQPTDSSSRATRGPSMTVYHRSDRSDPLASACR